MRRTSTTARNGYREPSPVRQATAASGPRAGRVDAHSSPSWRAVLQRYASARHRSEILRAISSSARRCPIGQAKEPVEQDLGLSR